MLDERIAEILRESRDKSGMSRATLASKLQVSKSTIQHWEEAESVPNITTLIKWFDVIDIPIYPYLFRLFHPEFNFINADSTDEEIKDALIVLLDDMDINNVRQNFFEHFGHHGTPPRGMSEVKTAYLHLPMDVKVGIAEIICTQFEICQAQNRLVQPDHVMPNIPELKKYIESAKQAVIEGKDTYIPKD